MVLVRKESQRTERDVCGCRRAKERRRWSVCGLVERRRVVGSPGRTVASSVERVRGWCVGGLCVLLEAVSTALYCALLSTLPRVETRGVGVGGGGDGGGISRGGGERTDPTCAKRRHRG